MIISLYNNKSEKIVVDKDITKVADLNANIKTSCSVVNPVFEFSGNELPAYNYIYCEQLGRYYYVNEIKSITGNVWEISCSCDVLMSYKTDFRKLTAIIARQEHNSNLYYNDGTFRCYQNPKKILKEFPNGFSNSPSFVLTVLGGTQPEE